MRMFAGRMAITAVMTVALGAGAMATVPAAAASAHQFVPPPVQKVTVLPRIPAASPAGQAAREQVSAAAAVELKGHGIKADSAWPSARSGIATLPAVERGAAVAVRGRLAGCRLPWRVPGLVRMGFRGCGCGCSAAGRRWRPGCRGC